MRSVASNASYKLPAPLLSRVSTEKRREGEVEWMGRGRSEGERGRGERERGVWRPRFSSRDVNNDRNDRIRPRPLVFRVTSGRVIASPSPFIEAQTRFPNRGRNPPPPPPPPPPFLLPLLAALYSTAPPPPPPAVSLLYRGRRLDTRYERGGCAYLRVRPGFTQTYDAQQSDRGKSCPSVPQLRIPFRRILASSRSHARSLARPPPLSLISWS